MCFTLGCVFIERVSEERPALEKRCSKEAIQDMQDAVQSVKVELHDLIKANRGRLSIGILDSSEQNWHPSERQPFWDATNRGGKD